MILFGDLSPDYRFMDLDYPVDFTVDGWCFSSVIQYLMFGRAWAFGDLLTAWKIQRERDARTLRQLGKIVEGFDQKVWEAQRETILARGLTARFDQHPEDIMALLGTDDATLVYCDLVYKEWGIGMTERDPDAYDMEQWKGENLLGYALMALRRSYHDRTPEGAVLALKLRQLVVWSPSDLPKEWYQGLNREDVSRMERFHASRYGWRNGWPHPPYEGVEPFVYLSYSIPNLKLAIDVAKVLDRMGYQVWYDDHLEGGRIWTGRRAAAIERSSVILEVHTDGGRYSHLELLARQFGELIDKPIVRLEMDEALWELEADDPACVCAHVHDKDFPERLRGALEGMGFDSEDEPSGDRPADHDLMVRYYQHYRAKCSYPSAGLFSRDSCYLCNLRTREVFRTDGSRLTSKPDDDGRSGHRSNRHSEPVYLSDEQAYRAIVWKDAGFELADRSEERDYIGMPDDWAFARHLAELETGIDEEISAQYRAVRDQVDAARADYPYMDEFEYIDSLFDDD